MSKSAFPDTAMNLVGAAGEIFEAELVASTGTSTRLLERALDGMAALRPDPGRGDPGQLPACRHLPGALDHGEAGPARVVAAAIRRLEPELAWEQNPRYNEGNMGARFMLNYAWSALGLCGGNRFSFGVLLLGPGITYPPTSYDSEGVFLVIGGNPEWKSGDDPWVPVQAGNIICRPHGGAEGKRTGNLPMLALYAWSYR